MLVLVEPASNDDADAGPDDRISDFTYELTARHLRFLGFDNLAQLDECIATFKDDGDRVSRVVFKTRCGQVTRLELLLLASMGDNFIQNHPWVDSEYYREMLISEAVLSLQS